MQFSLENGKTTITIEVETGSAEETHEKLNKPSVAWLGIAYLQALQGEFTNVKATVDVKEELTVTP